MSYYYFIDSNKKWERSKDDKTKEGRSEVLIEPLKPVSFLRRFNPFSKCFLSKYEPTIYFDTTRKNKIYFRVIPKISSSPKDFEFVVDDVYFLELNHPLFRDGTKNEIKFDKNYSCQVTKKSIQYHFPSPGLVKITYKILNENKNYPLDSNGREVILTQRNLSGEINRSSDGPPHCNQGESFVIVIDYHQKILIKLTWGLIYLTGILTVLTLLLLFITKNSLVK